MRCAAFPILMLALAAAGCAQSPDYWYRAASNPDQASKDERTCRTDAIQVARQRSRDDVAIMEDRTSAADYSSASISSSDLNINRYERLAAVERDNVRDLTRACMADRGYRLRNDD
jgi:hypothetical protein